jgi:hypothetical protein
MAPGGNYDGSGNIDDPHIMCPSCGHTFKQSRGIKITYTNSSSIDIFETKSPRRHQPQNLTKTHHWKKKNVPKF